MPRVFNQKIKILYLMRVFLERTDEEHPMSVKELIIYLNSLGISAERKTVYLNRPFIYMLIDSEAKLPVFMGTVMDIKE